MKRILAAVTLLPVFATSVFAEPDVNAAAEDVCGCLEAPYEQVSQAIELLNQAQASGDMSQLVAAQGEMMAVVNASNQCFEELTQQYPEIAASDELQDEVMALAEQLCPNPASQMQAAP